MAEYYEHNDFDEGFDFTQGEIDNPFGPAIKENEEKMISFNEDKNLVNSKIGKVMEEDISSIPFNEKNNEMINLNINNNVTPSFHMKNSGNGNNINNKNFEENDLASDINIINNLNDKFNEQINKKIGNNNNIQRLIDINEEFEEKIESNIKNEILNNNTFNNIDNNENIEEKKDTENNKNDYNNLGEQNDNNNLNKKEENNDMNKVIKSENKDQTIQFKDKQAIYYGILGILGLFCLKSLFSSNNVISIDSFLNLVILGIIFFVLYKTQIQ